MAQLMIKPKVQFLDSNGDPLANGKVYTYEAGTTTPLATYTDKGGLTANANPVILNSRGEADIWLADDNYKVVLTDTDDVTIYTVDNIKPINDGSISTAMLAADSVTTEKIADGAVTAAKLGTGFYGLGESTTKIDDYTATVNDDIILLNAIAQDITLSMPQASLGEDKVITAKRIDDTDIQTDTFVDGDVTVGTETINAGTHPFYSLQRVQLTTDGVLPTGLSLATDYWVIYVDANNIKLASSLANAQSSTAVDITAASGGGTHTITSQRNTVTIDGYMAEEVDGAATISLGRKNDSRRLYCDGASWQSIGHMVKDPEVLHFGDEASGLKIVENSGNIEIFRNFVKIAEFDASGLLGGGIKDATVTYEKLESLNYNRSSLHCGSYSTTQTTYTAAITNASTSITTHGRPVLVFFVADGADDQFGHFGTTSPYSCNLAIFRDTTMISEGIMVSSGGGAHMHGLPITLDVVAAGTYSYSGKIKTSNAAGAAKATNMRIVAVEL